MMISDEQVRRVVEYLQTTERESAQHCDPIGGCIPDELVQRAFRAASDAPEVRDERVRHARAMLAGEVPSSSDVAAKLIGRVISDSLR